ncbi:MAG: 16S rRNA pseudouridine(516) synthase [Oleibacter sp.]|nr:16S rRNA pseudouridine(516) synthase [Thalassolituus sp.]
MASNKFRLDRFLSMHLGVPKGDIRLWLAQQRVLVDGVVAQDTRQAIDQFSQVIVDGEIVQDNRRCYVMLNKPAGVVSATRDEEHDTVISCLEGLAPDIRSQLHIVGRLDLHSTGLLLLTNDSAWSKRLMSPENKVAKTYQVTVEHPISDECIAAFAEGLYFPYEDITTRPAVLERLAPCVAQVVLEEGRYHQIKRMFGRFRNPVLALHRSHIGHIQLEPELAPGHWRELNGRELDARELTAHEVDG